MKIISIALLLIAPLANSAPFDFLIQQRNIADTATFTRVAPLPMLNTSSLLGVDQFTNLPMMISLSQPFSIQSGALMVSQTWGDILNKPSFSSVATSGAYSDLSGAPSIPGAQVSSDWAASSGISQVLNKPTTLAGYGIADAYPLSGNPSSFITQSGARSSVTMTTTGTSGAATYNSSTGVLNIPNYAAGTGTVTSVTVGSGLSGGTFTTSGTISMPIIGTAGTYSAVTTDAQGRVTAGTSRSISNTPGRALVSTTTSTGFQISASRDSVACYEGSFSTTSTIGGPSAASVFLETADTNSTTAGDWTTIGKQTYSNNITLAIVLNQVQGNNWSMCRYIPAGKFVRIRSGSISGTASASINAEQQEVLQ